jgi:hypothetical protein
VPMWLIDVVCAKEVGYYGSSSSPLRDHNALWSAVFNRLGLVWVMLRRVEDIFVC